MGFTAARIAELTRVELQTRQRPAELAYGGETLHYTYYAGRIELDGELDMRRLRDSASGALDDTAAKRMLAELVVKYVASWSDMYEHEPDPDTGDPGPLLPLDVEHVLPLDYHFLTSLLHHTFLDVMTPPGAPPASSSEASDQQPEPTQPPNRQGRRKATSAHAATARPGAQTDSRVPA